MGYARVGWSMAILAAIAGTGRASAADMLPVESYAAIPLASSARLSPDGTRLALIAPRQGKDALIIHDLKGTDHVMDLGQFQALWVAWKSDTRLIAGVSIITDALFLEQTGRATATRLYGFDADGGNVKNIGEPINGFQIGATGSDNRIHPQFQDELASLLEADPHHVLQTVLDSVPYTNEGRTPSVWRVDVDTGGHERVLGSRPFIWEYGADPAGTLRLSSGINGTTAMVSVRDATSGDWRVIHRRDVNRDAWFEPLAFSPEAPTTLYVNGTDTAGHTGLWAFDTVKGGFDHLIDGTVTPRADITLRGDRLVGYETGDGTMKYLDPVWQSDAETIRHALPAKQIALVDRTADGKRLLIAASVPHGPEAWWMLDRSVTPARLAPVIQTYPAIAAAGIAPVTKITYAARDGLPIPAWLTLPQGGAHGPLPFVVLPHGGPNSCDDEGFDFVAQFLASRGYGVLQPEFRGSDCYDMVFEQRGFREWGFAMQDDVTDGTHWLIDHKLADPARICIAGMSYGGYAALEGVAKEPDLYRCAAAWAPVTDLRHLLSDMRKNLLADASVERLGTDADRLAAASPAAHAERIKVPVLLVHGRSDATVQVEHSERMEAALKAAGKPVEAIYIDNSDHYMRHYDARLAWLKALERFLASNLGASVEK